MQPILSNLNKLMYEKRQKVCDIQQLAFTF